MQKRNQQTTRQAVAFAEGVEIGRDLFFEVAFMHCWPDGTEARRCLASQLPSLHEERRPDAPTQLQATIRELTSQRRTALLQGEITGFLAVWMEDITAQVAA